jgi:2-polyprenyl-6-methoxyphenol hydroxylase-like FAD-dependent oxidoreductase
MIESTSVLIVGAGPVGLCLAMDLASRGIDVLVCEQRAANEAPSVKCNHVSSRTMESLRRLGVSSRVRAAGLPADYPNDIVFRTRANGYEYSRIRIPSRKDRYIATDGPDCGWPTPEPPHRVNQIYLEPILFDGATAAPGVKILSRTSVTAFSQDDDKVVVNALDLSTGCEYRISAHFLIGCDGGRSMVRHGIGATLNGDPEIQRVQSSFIRAPELINIVTKPHAWMSYLYHPLRAGNLVAIDGKELWLFHNYLFPHEKDFSSVDRDTCIRLLLGVDASFHYELLSKEDWIGRRLVADRFRDGRVLICGDAAHLWVPYAGYGMNAGIADAMNLSWLLAAHLRGWAPAAILNAYTLERRPITEQVSRFAMKHAESVIAERSRIPAEVEENTEAGAAARARIGQAAYRLNVEQFACAGLNFGYYYDQSPLIAYDGQTAPTYTMHHYTPSTTPGCRLPHFWLSDGRSLYDAMGADYVLLRFDASLSVDKLLSAAADAHVPMTLLDIDLAEIPAPYAHRLVLSRPDRHVAWRGNSLPNNSRELIRLISGHGDAIREMG